MRFLFFFFQAEDGIRDYKVTGVQTCALPICSNPGGATLSGTLLVAAVGGVASFGDLSLNRTAPGYTLTASGGGPGPGPSTPLRITPGPDPARRPPHPPHPSTPEGRLRLANQHN